MTKPSMPPPRKPTSMHARTCETGPPRSVTWRASYARYVAARGISTAGTNLVNVVLAFAVLQVGGSGFSAGLVLGCAVLAQTLLLPVGGVLADRLSRTTLAAAGNAVLAAVQVTVGTLLAVAPEQAQVWMLAAASATTGAATAAVQPAFQGLIVQLVPTHALQRANASLRLVLNLARVAVPGLGALLGAALGFGQVLLISGLSFTVCASILPTLRPSTPVRRSPSLIVGVREGLHAFRSRPWLWAYAASGTLAVPLWLAGYQLLGPLSLAEQPDGAGHWGWAVSAFSAGMVLGSVVALRWKPHRLMLACVLIQLLWPLPLAALAVGAPLPWLLVSMLISGLSLDLAVVFFETAKQQQIPEELIGRITSLTLLSENALVPAGYVLAGTVADRLGSAAVIWICCMGIFLSIGVLLCIPGIRGLTATSHNTKLSPERQPSCAELDARDLCIRPRGRQGSHLSMASCCSATSRSRT